MGDRQLWPDALSWYEQRLGIGEGPDRVPHGMLLQLPQDIMIKCWHKEPDSRPTFESLQVQLEDFFTDDTGYQKVDDV